MKSSGPDFIVIGAMKCATSTLHRQLAMQPGIFMSEPKEPNFFSDDANHARGMDWYAGLFAAAPEGALRGESSTHYSKLPTYPHTVERLRAALPDVRIVYVIRHPLERLVSQYIHEWSQRVIDCDLDQAIDRHPELVAYSRYAMQLAPYLENWGRERMLLASFERLREAPQAEFARICRFIGLNREAHWHDDLPPENVSSQRIRRFPLYGPLIESPLAMALRRTLVPRRLRDRVKSRLTLSERPRLTESLRKRVEASFDEELAQLGGWVGLPDLRCDNFRQLTTRYALDWSDPDG